MILKSTPFVFFESSTLNVNQKKTKIKNFKLFKRNEFPIVLNWYDRENAEHGLRIFDLSFPRLIERKAKRNFSNNLLNSNSSNIDGSSFDGQWSAIVTQKPERGRMNVFNWILAQLLLIYYKHLDRFIGFIMLHHLSFHSRIIFTLIFIFSFLSEKSIFVLSFNWIFTFFCSLVTRDKPARFLVLVALLQHPVWLPQKIDSVLRMKYDISDKTNIYVS